MCVRPLCTLENQRVCRAQDGKRCACVCVLMRSSDARRHSETSLKEKAVPVQPCLYSCLAHLPTSWSPLLRPRRAHTTVALDSYVLWVCLLVSRRLTNII